MKETFKNLILYLLLILLTLGCIRLYDYITKDPTPVDRKEDPKITAINKRIDAVLDSVTSYKKTSADAMASFYLSIDSVKNYRKTTVNESKKLKSTPDSMLNHRKDSILRANGIK